LNLARQQFGKLDEVLCMPKGALAVVSHVEAAAPGTPMSLPQALAGLAALGQPTRLAIFRLLMQREPAGLLAGAIAEAVGCPANTLSSHIAILARAGLVRGERDGRSITYRADVGGMRALMSFLITDCCNGHPELCEFNGKQSSDCGCSPPSNSKKRKR
jgi:ArsR family transcriptional regulator, arsenate/arsenite/antimonite-responsive transcriptional repressor